MILILIELRKVLFTIGILCLNFNIDELPNSGHKNYRIAKGTAREPVPLLAFTLDCNPQCIGHNDKKKYDENEPRVVLSARDEIVDTK